MTIDPREAEAQRLADGHRDGEAIALWMELFSADPSRVDLARRLALAMGRLGQRAQAAELLSLASALHPRDAELHTLRGNLLKALGRLDEALAAQQRALALAPDSAAIRGNLCALFLARAQPAEALRWAEEALALAPGNPELRFNRGTCLLRLGRASEAAQTLEALTLDAPAHASTWVNLGEARLELSDTAGAQRAFRRALAVDPENADAHFNLALRLLAAESWAEGFLEYEWRRRIADIPRRALEGPGWDGGALPPGSTLLLTAEQGLGDTLQFLRFAPLAREASGARVLLECPAALAALLRTCPAVDALVPLGQPLPPWTAQCALLSLPARLGCRALPPPLRLQAPPALVAQWRARISGPLPGRGSQQPPAPAGPSEQRLLAPRTVAICWQGNPSYKADARRSVPLALFEPLAQVPGVRLVSVQKQHGREQLARWPAALPLLELGAELDEGTGPFLETAAVLAAADLLITSDTAVPHLAGALGRPVWLLLGHRPDWRWDTPAPHTTPWYPSFRLFRQGPTEAWGAVFERVRAALAAVDPGAPEV